MATPLIWVAVTIISRSQRSEAIKIPAVNSILIQDGQLELDSHVDTCVAGAMWKVMKYTGVVCNVYPYSDSYKPLKQVPVVKLNGEISFMNTCYPNELKLERCTHISLTSSTVWELQLETSAEQEAIIADNSGVIHPVKSERTIFAVKLKMGGDDNTLKNKPSING